MMEPFDDDYVTRTEVQEMIDAAIRRHNRNASIISMCVGWVVLALFAEGLLRLVGVIPPYFHGSKLLSNNIFSSLVCAYGYCCLCLHKVG
jgi:hypothetical protein